MDNSFYAEGLIFQSSRVLYAFSKCRKIKAAFFLFDQITLLMFESVWKSCWTPILQEDFLVVIKYVVWYSAFQVHVEASLKYKPFVTSRSYWS